MNYQERLNLFKQLVIDNKTMTEIVSIMSITTKSVLNYEKTLGIKSIRAGREPNLNKFYFENIDNEYKAYILGFIFADGYLESNDRTLTFNINKKDIDILYKIKEQIECGNEIHKSSTKNCIKLYLSSKKLCDDLKRYSVKRNKTSSIEFPQLKNELYRHFIRGYFDGDGHIGKRQCALVIGSENMFNGFMEFITDKFNKTLYFQKVGNYYRVQLNRKDSDIVKWLYRNNNICLDRKNKTFVENWDCYTEKIRSRG